MSSIQQHAGGLAVVARRWRGQPGRSRVRPGGDPDGDHGTDAAHANEYQVDPGRISIMGGSAGSTLAMPAAASAGGTLSMAKLHG